MPSVLSPRYYYSYDYEDGLSAAVIAGIVIGALAGLATLISLIILICCLSKRRKREREAREQAQAQFANAHAQPLMMYYPTAGQPGQQPLYQYGQQPVYAQQPAYGQSPYQYPQFSEPAKP